MNKIEIKNRWTNETIFAYEEEDNTIKKTVQKAVEKGVNLAGADLREADLEGANLEKANLEKANLREADLEGANLERANLEGTNLLRANLTKANLAEASLLRANLEMVILKEANLKNTNLKGAYIYTDDDEIDVNDKIKKFEENAGIKITESYTNKYIFPTRWNYFWDNGLIICKWKVKEKAKKMTIAEIENILGYKVEIIPEEN